MTADEAKAKVLERYPAVFIRRCECGVSVAVSMPYDSGLGFGPTEDAAWLDAAKRMEVDNG